MLNKYSKAFWVSQTLCARDLNWNFEFNVVFLAFFLFYFVYIIINEPSFKELVCKLLHTLFLASTFSSAVEVSVLLVHVYGGKKCIFCWFVQGGL